MPYEPEDQGRIFKKYSYLKCPECGDKNIVKVLVDGDDDGMSFDAPRVSRCTRCNTEAYPKDWSIMVPISLFFLFITIVGILILAGK